MRQATAAEVRRNASAILKAPRRMPVAEAVQKFMRVPLLDKVNSTLNADEIRPLTDFVTVKSATIANYAVTAELEIPEGPDASTVLNNAIDVLRSYTTLSHRIKTVIPLSAIYASLQQSGVVRVRLISPVEDLEAEAGKAPWCTAINVTRREVSSNDG